MLCLFDQRAMHLPTCTTLLKQIPSLQSHSLSRATLALDIVHDPLIQSSILHAHLASKCVCWDPLAGRSRGSLLHHLVDLLERKTLCLRDEEVCVHKRARAQTTPDEEDGRAEVTLVGVDHVRCDDSDDGVPEPVGRSGESDTTRTDGEREDLADEDPSTRTCLLYTSPSPRD